VIRPVLAIGLIVAAWAAVGASARALPFACPRGVVYAANASPGIVGRAVLQLVPTAYASLESQGSRAWPHAKVAGAVSLAKRLYAPQPPLRTLAVHLCGANVADASWVVFFDFPECQMPCSEDTAIAARTERGWVIWYSEYRRP
jgi:hypothetical protein